MSIIDWQSERGREVARTILQHPNVSMFQLAKLLGVKKGSASAYFYDFKRYRQAHPNIMGGYAKATKPPALTAAAIHRAVDLMDKATVARYPNGGVSGALMELKAERARIDAAITALESVTLAKATT